MKNPVHIKVCGRTYTMLTDESDEYTARLSHELTGRIEKLSGACSLSITDSAILTALSLMDDLNKNSCNTNNISSQINEYVQAANKAQNKLEEANALINKQKDEIYHLKEQIAKLEKELAKEKEQKANNLISNKSADSADKPKNDTKTVSDNKNEKTTAKEDNNIKEKPAQNNRPKKRNAPIPLMMPTSFDFSSTIENSSPAPIGSVNFKKDKK